MKLTHVIRTLFSLGLFFGAQNDVLAQVGGTFGFTFLQDPGTARISALGGVNITSQEEDVNMLISNPALLVREVHQHASINYLNYLSDIQYTTLSYAHEFDQIGLWGVGLQYFSYGVFEGYDEAGNEGANFNARDFAITISHSRTVGVFSLGANIKFAQSHLETYTASAALLDIGGVYKHPQRDITVGLVIKNLGIVFSDYTKEANTSLPFDVQLGATFKPEHMPFRFSITGYNLTRGDIAYYDPRLGNNKEKPGFVDKLLRHVTVGTEVLLSKNFNLRVGYNHLVRKELRLEETSGGAGISMGLMFRIKAFELAYSGDFTTLPEVLILLPWQVIWVQSLKRNNCIKEILNMLDRNKYLTPREIVSELDKYIIGQKDAKRNVSIALRNRWRRMNVGDDMRNEIMPNNILLIGATGVGKTEIARRLAKIADAPFTKVEASKFTEVGYVGRDVESMVRDLVEHAVNMVKISKKEEVQEKASQIVEDIILDALIPPLKYKSPTNTSISSDDNGSVPENDQELNERTRAKFREKIRNGDLDDRKIDINIKQGGNGGLGMIGGGMMDEASMINLQEMINNMMPKKNKRRKVTIGEAKKILLEEEASKLIDMDEVKEEAIKKAEDTGIIFIDEIDKIAGGSKKNGGGGPDVSREGVQRDLLPIVEGSAVNTKYGIIHTDHILFIAAGAFHIAKPSDLIPELQGRFPIRVELENLTKEDFYKILKEPKNALTKQYEALFTAEDVSLTFQDEALEEIAEIAFQINTEIENIGARRLHTVVSQLLNEFLFDVPDVIGPNAQLTINRAMVKERLAVLVKNKDLSQYIL